MGSVDRERVLKEVNEIVSDILQLPDLVMESSTSAADVPGRDSLTHIQIIIAIERKYAVRFTSTEVALLGDIMAATSRPVF